MEGYTKEQWEALKNVDIETVDPDTLVDIQNVVISPELGKEERIREFIRQIKNPYCFKCGKLIIKACFSDTDKTIEDRMAEYLDLIAHEG